jgi:TPR repeat protein
VKQDLTQAAMWYRKAAAFGIEDAKKRLAALEFKMKSPAK